MTIPMIDATHANLARIPAAVAAVLPKVCGYDSGTPDIEWTGPDWSRFPRAGHMVLEQGYTWTAAQILACDGFDVERGTLTAVQAAEGTHMRVAAGIEWTVIYGSDGSLAAVEQALMALGHGWYYGHVEAFLADWDLDLGQATAKLGTEIHGLTCRAVQWAPASLNASTLIPGTSLTLGHAQADLSVTDATWHAYVPPAPVPVPVPKPVEHGYLVTAGSLGSFAGRAVSSGDGGKTWA
jgi:hypothetical protein